MERKKKTSMHITIVVDDNMIWVIFLVLLVNSEGKLICSPNQTNSSCQWSLFGWEIYHGCGYKQKINEHLCIIKNLDGSKSTFLIKMNLSSMYQYCLVFKYLITGSVIDVCLNFYGKTQANITKLSTLFSTFCIPKRQTEFYWYSFNILLPENMTIINVVTESNIIDNNHSLIIKDLSIQQCNQIPTVDNILLTNSTIESTFVVEEKTFLIRYRWILIIGIILLSILVTIILYISYQTVHQQSTISQRIQISPVIHSQHFYEEPISIILPPSIEISIYDHVRDNYV